MTSRLGAVSLGRVLFPLGPPRLWIWGHNQWASPALAALKELIMCRLASIRWFDLITIVGIGTRMVGKWPKTYWKATSARCRQRVVSPLSGVVGSGVRWSGCKRDIWDEFDWLPTRQRSRAVKHFLTLVIFLDNRGLDKSSEVKSGWIYF